MAAYEQFRPGRVVVFRLNGEPQVDVISAVVLSRVGVRWFATQIYTRLHETGHVAPDDVLELVDMPHFRQRPVKARRPPHKPGDRIRFDAGSGLEEGTVLAVSMVFDDVVAPKGEFNYDVVEQPGMEPIRERWLKMGASA